MSDPKPDLFDFIEHNFGRAGDDGKIYRSPQFDAATAHVVTLLDDAMTCYRRGSFGTAAFLAITALEETAKAELFGFRARPADSKPKRDPLRSHAAKHWIAVRDTLFMGKRLVDALGQERCAAIQADAAAGRLVALREAALYFDFVGNTFATPAEAVSQPLARELLLVAVEAADDILVGFTNASYLAGHRFDAIFEELAGGA